MVEESKVFIYKWRSWDIGEENHMRMTSGFGQGVAAGVLLTLFDTSQRFLGYAGDFINNDTPVLERIKPGSQLASLHVYRLHLPFAKWKASQSDVSEFFFVYVKRFGQRIFGISDGTMTLA